MNEKYWRRAACLLAALTLLPVAAANAGLVDTILGDWDPNLSTGGFFRSETAISITSEDNPYNQRGNLFNGERVKRVGAAVGIGASQVIFRDTVVRPVEDVDRLVNYQIFRLEADFALDLWDNLKFEAHMRAIWDPNIYENFDPATVATADPVGPLHGYQPNLFEYHYDSQPARFYNPAACANGHEIACEPQKFPRGSAAARAAEAARVAALGAEESSSPLEWAGREYMIDFPQFFLEYQNGPLFIRAGNQVIAWGDLIFFRIIDVANGLDFRRHSLLDLVSEEFSDKRIPALGIRVGYQLPYQWPLVGGWGIDAYVQRFRGNIYPNPNTPYNIIPAQFTVHDMYGQYDDEVNYGIKINGRIGPVDVSFMVNRRYNPWGAFQWTDSDVTDGLQPGGPAGVLTGDGSASNGGTLLDGVASLLESLGLGLDGLNVPLTGGFLADSIFEVDPTGITSAKEFYTYGALARLNHFTGLNKGIKFFPAAQALTAAVQPNAAAQEKQEDFFLQLSGGLRGHIRREYYRENNYGLSLAYRWEGPDTMFTDQVNLSLELKYTTDRAVLTTTDLHPLEATRVDELEVGLIAQKFVRYSSSFPAMFVVLQYYHRTETDLFYRDLSGYGGTPSADDPAERLPDGRSSWNAIAFAFQQPWPGRIFRLDFAMLWDLKGGFLFQPAFRYTPNDNWRFQIFANIIETIYGEPNENALSTVDYADEVTVRISYFF